VAVLQLDDPGADKIQLQQYRVSLQQNAGANKGGTLQGGSDEVCSVCWASASCHQPLTGDGL
jgi:hypothetical protein